MKIHLCLAGLFLLTALPGCVSTKIESTGSAQGTKHPQRLLIIANLDRGGALSSAEMENTFTTHLQNCGVSVQFLPIGGLNLGGIVRTNIALFHPDLVLEMNWTRETELVPARYGVPISHGPGSPESADYKLALMDMVSHQIVWRADMNWHAFAYLSVRDIGRSIGEAVINKMTDDNILAPGCRIAETQGPESTIGVPSAAPPSLPIPMESSQTGIARPPEYKGPPPARTLGFIAPPPS